MTKRCRQNRRRLTVQSLENRRVLAAGLDIPAVESSGPTGVDVAMHNASMPTDVNNDGMTSAVDAVYLVRVLSRMIRDGESPGEMTEPGMCDVNGDGMISATDALDVIRVLGENARGDFSPATNPPAADQGSGETEDQGELADPGTDENVADQNELDDDAVGDNDDVVLEDDGPDNDLRNEPNDPNENDPGTNEDDMGEEDDVDGDDVDEDDSNDEDPGDDDADEETDDGNDGLTLRQIAKRLRFAGLSVEALLDRFDSDEDGQLSGNEVKQQLADRLDDLTADSNEDGFYSAEELNAVISDARQSLFDVLDDDQDGLIGNDSLAGRILQRYADADTNDDGAISFEEFDAAVPAVRDLIHRPHGLRGALPGVLQMLLRIDVDQLFSSADANNDGVLTADEVNRRFLFAAGRLISDNDGDGTISLEEATAALTRARRIAFDLRDTDGDGAITQAEVRDRVWAKLSDADMNDDAAVSFEEFTAMLDADPVNP
ncbi:MAG: dockerin type I domain-containing protein, partial [Planctomycetota bacterium]